VETLPSHCRTGWKANYMHVQFLNVPSSRYVENVARCTVCVLFAAKLYLTGRKVAKTAILPKFEILGSCAPTAITAKHGVGE